MSAAILALLVGWLKAFEAEPFYTTLIGVGAGLGAQAAAARALAARIQASGGLAGRPVLVLSAAIVLGVCLLWAAIDAILLWQGALTLGERLLVLLLPTHMLESLPAGAALLESLPADAAQLARQPADLPSDLVASLPAGAPLHLPPAVTIPLGLFAAGALHLGIGAFLGGILAELVALQARPDDVVQRERERTARARAEAEARAAEAAEAEPRAAEAAEAMPRAALAVEAEPRAAETVEVAAAPMPDDRLGRLYKLLGHWSDPVYVEPRFLRWYEPSTRSLRALVLAGALPCTLGYLAVPVWVGAIILASALRLPARLRPAQRASEQADERAAEAIAEAATEDAPAAADRPFVPFVEDPAIASHLTPVVWHEDQAPAGDPRADRAGNPGGGRLWRDILGALGVSALHGHQARAVRAFAVRRSVLLCTPPDSGRALVTDALVLQAVLGDAESVLYLAPDVERARAARARFDARAEATHWKWNIAATDLSGMGAGMGAGMATGVAGMAGTAGAADPGRSQPTLVFADPEAVHRELCARQERWQTFLAGLGTIVLPDVHEHAGARAAHLAHLRQRLYRAMHRARAASEGRSLLAAEGASARAAARVLVTADPAFADLVRHAQRIVGGTLERIGPEHDTAPRPQQTVHVVAPARTGAPADLRGIGAPGAAGALALRDAARARGLRVALHGYDDVLAADEQVVDAEVADAEVIVARLSPARAGTLPVMSRHLGGAGRDAGQQAGAHPVAVLWQPDPDPLSGLIFGQRSAQLSGQSSGRPPGQLADRSETLPAETPPAQTPPAETPPAHAIAGDGVVMSERLGVPALVAWPRAPEVERAHLLYTLAESEVLEEELERCFSRHVLRTTLAALDARGRLIACEHRLLDPASGMVRTVRGLRLAAPDGMSGDAPADVPGDALAVCGAPWHLVERATGAVVGALEAARAPAAAYPRRILIAGGRRFGVLDAEAQDQHARGRILCEPVDEMVMTVPIRVLDIAVVERRVAERRAVARAGATGGGERRRDGMRSVGGVPFSLQHRDADIDETVLGVRRFDLRGRAMDSTGYDEPVRCRFRGRVAVLAFPGQAPAPEVLHALVHGFRICMPVHLCHGEDDLEIALMPAHGHEGAGGDARPDASGAIAFVDMHPGGAGFAEAVGLEVIGALLRRTLALVRGCPARCSTGCPACLHTWTCRAPAEHHQRVDKAGAESLLAALLGTT